MNRDAQPHPRTKLRSATRALAAVVGTVLICSQFACGGGSSGGNGGGGTAPPQRSFTTIDVDVAGAANLQGTEAVAINSAGEIAGVFIDSNGVDHGFIRSASGAITTFDVEGSTGQGTLVSGMDLAGDIVGFYDDGTGSHSFLRTADGTITKFDPPGSQNSIAESINDSGTVAGSSLGFILSSSVTTGYLRAANGGLTTFDAPASFGQPVIFNGEQINASGAVSGYFIDSGGVAHGFLRDTSGNVTVLDAPGAGTGGEEGTEMLAMNAAGTTVGLIAVGIVNGANATHAVKRTADGSYTVFDPPAANGVSSAAYAINDNGAIVGTYRGTDFIRHAYLLQPDGTFVTFDDPQGQLGPLTLSDVGTLPRAINSTGAVVGFYSDANGARHGFIWQ